MKKSIKITLTIGKGIAIILLSFLFGSLIEMLFNWILGLMGITIHKNLNLLMMYAWIFLVFWILLKYWERTTLRSLGFQIQGHIASFFIGSLIGVLLMSIGLGVLLLTSSVSIESYSFRYNLIFAVFLDFVAVALLEEILCRGYLLRKFMNRMNKFVALAVSAIIFAAIHSANPSFSLLPFINLFLAGIFLGATYIYTRNLWFAIGLHLFWNFSQGLLGFNVSGSTTPSILILNYPENDIFNGGNFGFEGSIICLILQIIFIAGIILFYERKNKVA